MPVNLFFLYFKLFLPLTVNYLTVYRVLEQNTFNNCPVCGYPLTAESAVCPRCGNDILEEISSLDQQSHDLHIQNMEEKKAEWYSRNLVEILNEDDRCMDNPAQKITGQEKNRTETLNSTDADFLRTVSRSKLIQDNVSRKKWWGALSPDWKEVIRTTLKIVRDPSEQELLDILETTHLRCDNRRIHDLSPVRVLEKLQQLRCDESPVEDLEPLRNLEKLQRLYAFDCDFSSLEPLSNLANLKLLWISSTQISSLEPLRKLFKLEELYCSETLIDDLSPLSELVNLEKLSCYSTEITSLDPLARLENLIELGINNSRISDISPLSALVNLEYLRCSKTGIETLEPLRSIKSIRELSIAYTPLTSIEPLEEMDDLEELDISHTLVTTIAPIMHLQSLEKIELSANRIPREEIERFIELHPGCELQFKQ